MQALFVYLMNKFEWAFNEPEESRAFLEHMQSIYTHELEEYRNNISSIFSIPIVYFLEPQAFKQVFQPLLPP